MSLTGDTFDFQQGNVVTSSAQIVDNGATVGDVLTVQADKSIAAAPGGGSQPITRAQYDLALAVPTGTLTKLPFAFNYGTELLDLSDTTNPTPLESATYSFAVYVGISDVADDGKWFLVVTLDEDDFAGAMQSSAEITASSGVQAITFPFYVPAGSPCHVQVSHNDSSDASFNGHVYLQRLS